MKSNIEIIRKELRKELFIISLLETQLETLEKIFVEDELEVIRDICNSFNQDMDVRLQQFMLATLLKCLIVIYDFVMIDKNTVLAQLEILVTYQLLLIGEV